jgi:hypothetical protein
MNKLTNAERLKDWQILQKGLKNLRPRLSGIVKLQLLRIHGEARGKS